MEYTYHVPLYEGHIRWLMGEREQAESLWQRMLEENPDNWFVWSSMGDVRVKQCRYDEAIGHFKKAAGLEPAPRYTDNWLSIAEILTIQKRWAEAAAAYDKVAEIQMSDWSKDEDSFWVQENRKKAQELRTKA